MYNRIMVSYTHTRTHTHTHTHTTAHAQTRSHTRTHADAGTRACTPHRFTIPLLRHTYTSLSRAHALLLSSTLGADKFKSTASLFIQQSLMEGSPLRTISLLLAGRPQDLFLVNNQQHM